MDFEKFHIYVRSLPVGTKFQYLGKGNQYTFSDFNQYDIFEIKEHFSTETVYIQILRSNAERKWGYHWQNIFLHIACEKHFNE